MNASATQTRVTPDLAVEKIKAWEGFVPFTYDDADTHRPHLRLTNGRKPLGTATIGYGTTGKEAWAGRSVTEAQATQFLHADLRKFEACVDNAVKVPLTDNQYGALISFCYNVGRQAFIDSTLLTKLNKGQYEAIPAELLKWTHTTIGKKRVLSPGLVSRRNAEIGLWNMGSPDAPTFVSSEKATPPKRNYAADPKIVLGIVGAVGTAAQAGIAQLNPFADAIVYVKYAVIGLTGLSILGGVAFAVLHRNEATS